MKRLIAITLPTFFPGESQRIVQLLEAGLERIHLRKPHATIGQFRQLLHDIPETFHPRITLHDFFSLTKDYPAIGGIHLNSRNPEAPEYFKGTISRSCHSLQEIEENNDLSYLFLSPIFNSISKEGYGSTFPIDTLREAAAKGILTSQVFALGGISEETIPFLQGLPFGGVAVLGSLWGQHPERESAQAIINRFNRLLLCTQREETIRG